MRVWDLWHSVPPCSASTGEKATWYPCSIGLGGGHTEGVGCVTLSRRQTSYEEGRAAAYSASGDKIIKRWNLHGLLKANKGSSARSAEGTGQEVVARIASKDEGEAEVVTGLQGLSLNISQQAPSTTDSMAAALTCSHSVRGHEKDINCVTLSPNDALLASGSQDKTLKLWNAADLTPVATLRGHKRGKNIKSSSFASTNARWKFAR